MRRSGLLLAILLVFLPELLAAEVVVVDEEAHGLSGAQLMCIDPVGEVVRADRQGLAVLEASCRWARCDATGYLAGEVDLSRVAPVCHLRRGFLLRAFFAESAEGCEDCEAQLLSVRDGSTVAVAAVHPGAREAIRFPALPPGHYRLEISRGDGWTCSTVLAPAEASDRLVFVDWRAPKALHGWVETPDGGRAGGIPLRVGETPGSFSFGAWSCRPQDSPAIRSGEDGSFEIPLDPGREHLVVAGDWDAEGLAAWALLPRGHAGGGELRLSLAPPAWILAQVQDEEGNPVACDARLSGLPRAAAWAASLLGSSFEASCDATGQLSLGPLPALPFSLELRPESGLTLRRSANAADRGGVVDLGVLTASPGRQLDVSVLDTSGAPLPGAELVATLVTQLVVPRRATTDDAGKAQIRGIPDDAGISLDVSAPGFVPQRREGLVAGDGPLLIALEPGGTIRGEVLDAEGEGLPGVFVSCEVAGARAGETRTDDTGRFLLDALPAGEIRLSGSLPGYRERDRVRVDLAPASEAAGVILVLEAAPRRGGRVRDTLGKPVAQASVLVIHEQDLPRCDDAPRLAQTATDGDGRFDLPLLGVDAVVVVIRAPGRAPVAIRQEAFPEDRDLDVVLPAAARLAVTLPVGGPAIYQVLVLDGAGVGHLKEGAQGGEIVFEDLAPGAGRVSLMTEASTPLRLRPGKTARVEVSAGVTLAGRVIRHGAGVGDAVVLAARPGAWGPTQISDQDGSFRFEGLAAGPRIVVAEGPGGRAEETIKLPAEGEVDLDLALEDYRLDLRVLDSHTRDGIPGATVYLVPEENEGREPWFRAQFEPWSRASFEPWSRAPVEPGPASGAGSGSPGIKLELTDTRGAIAISDALGLASVRVAQGGAHVLRAQAEGYARNELYLDLEEGCHAQEILLESRLRRGLNLRLETIPPGMGGALLCRAAGRPFSWHFAEGKGACEDPPQGPVEVFFRVAGVGSVRAEYLLPAEGVIEESLILREGATLLVPVRGDNPHYPAIRDLDGVDWARAWRQIDPLGQDQPQREYDPELGEVWIFRDLPEGVYEVSVGGEARDPVVLVSGGRSVAR